MSIKEIKNINIERFFKVMKTKYYAVRKGKKTGIFDNWKECEENIKNFSGAEYKSFNNKNDAEKYINIYSESNLKQKENNHDNYQGIVYVDGSFDSKNLIFTYGLIFINKEKQIKIYEKFNHKKWAEMRNIAGEIMGAIKAMQFAIENNISSILIYHDYAGISKWCTGEWQTTKEETKAYKNFFDEINKILKIDFKWVKGHSGNKYNEEADRLANLAYKLTKFSKPLIDIYTVYIDRDNLQNVVKKVLIDNYPNFEITFEEKGEKFNKFKISSGNNNTSITFNYKKTGDMSISYDGDSIGWDIKNIIEEQYAIKNKDGNSCLVFNVELNNINDLLSKLKLEKDISINEKSNINSDILKIYSIEYEINKVVLTIYKKGKILIQGKSSIIFSYILSLLNELKIIDSYKLIELTNNAYNLNNNLINIKKELNLIMKDNIFNMLHEFIQQNLLLSLTLTKIKFLSFDYAFVCFPALKALEGEIKQICKNYNFKTEPTLGSVFNIKNNIVTIKNEYSAIINDKQKENKLIELYDYLRKQRHTTIHLNSILESSRLIETIDEAKQIVNDIINNINDFYC